MNALLQDRQAGTTKQTSAWRDSFEEFRRAAGLHPLFLPGDSATVLGELPTGSIDCCMTSPPYWGQRSYSGGGIGLEEHYSEYVAHLLAIFALIKRVLKDSGSFWLNIGDAYYK